MKPSQIVLDKFSGKTIQSVNASSCNVWTFHFTDGTAFTIEVECMQSSLGLYGMSAQEGVPLVTQ